MIGRTVREPLGSYGSQHSHLRRAETNQSRRGPAHWARRPEPCWRPRSIGRDGSAACVIRSPAMASRPCAGARSGSPRSGHSDARFAFRNMMSSSSVTSSPRPCSGLTPCRRRRRRHRPLPEPSHRAADDPTKGSRYCLTTPCAMRSVTVGMPNGRWPPSALGIITRRTGDGM